MCLAHTWHAAQGPFQETLRGQNNSIFANVPDISLIKIKKYGLNAVIYGIAMETANLLNTLNSIAILSESLQDQIKACLVEEHFTRKSHLLKEGQVSQRIYFIKKGFIRAYYHKGNSEFSTWFMGEGEFIISVYSFFSRKPSFENIEVLEDCTLQSINWDQLQLLYKQHPEFNLTGRIITEQYYIRSEERAINLQTLTAKQRYEKLLADYPGILQKTTLGQIASYLSIKQETLSRIRGRK